MLLRLCLLHNTFKQVPQLRSQSICIVGVVPGGGSKHTCELKGNGGRVEDM